MMLGSTAPCGPSLDATARVRRAAASGWIFADGIVRDVSFKRAKLEPDTHEVMIMSGFRA